jgi:hypothetical protein
MAEMSGFGLPLPGGKQLAGIKMDEAAWKVQVMAPGSYAMQENPFFRCCGLPASVNTLPYPYGLLLARHGVLLPYGQ